MMKACKDCQGKGCLYCPPEKTESEVNPILTLKRDNPADMELIKDTIGMEALEKAFSKDGGGAQEIIENCQAATLLQSFRDAGINISFKTAKEIIR